MPLYAFEGRSPTVHATAFIAPTATLVGDVTVEEGASVWYGAVIRAAYSPVVIRAGAKVLDGAKVGARTLVAAHSLVAADADIPAGVLAAGSPAVVKKALEGTPAEF